MKKTLVLGASTNPERYSYKCISLLRQKGFETVAVGRKSGKVEDVDILTNQELFPDIDTVNIYLSAKNLQEYEDYLIQLKPNRILFPPGTENPEFEERLNKTTIKYERACPLVMLKTGTY